MANGKYLGWIWTRSAWVYSPYSSQPPWVDSKCQWLLMVCSAPENNSSFLSMVYKRLLSKKSRSIYININSDYLWMVKYEWFLFSTVCISWILWSEHVLLFITRNIMALFLWSFPPRYRVIGGHLMQFSHCLPSPPITLMEVLKSSIINDCFAYTWSLKAYKTHLL